MARTTFSDFSLQESVRRGVDKAGFVEPRPIQARVLRASLAGRDILGLAQTGTGKTAAFALTLLERLLAEPKPGPRALVVAPTRELAMQIFEEVRTLAHFTGLRATTIYGGVSARAQIRALRDRPDILVACPGRLLDLVRQGEAKLDRVEMLVLDEADHLFDMGFLPDVRAIIGHLPKRRQNLLFSATMPDPIRELTRGLLHRPHVVELAHSTPPQTVEHVLYPVPRARKAELLKHLLAGKEVTSAIVFSRTKFRAKRLTHQLTRVGINAVALQGNMSQSQRDRAMGGFRAGRFDVLVATDIAARGIDVAKVSHVINFDVPSTPDAYTHRIGRTGRSEEHGKAWTFVSEEDVDTVHAIERKLAAAIPRVHVAGFDGVTIPAGRSTRGRARKTAAPTTPRRRRRRRPKKSS